jgi:hypothetical protein
LSKRSLKQEVSGRVYEFKLAGVTFLPGVGVGPDVGLRVGLGVRITDDEIMIWLLL